MSTKKIIHVFLPTGTCVSMLYDDRVFTNINSIKVQLQKRALYDVENIFLLKKTQKGPYMRDRVALYSESIVFDKDNVLAVVVEYCTNQPWVGSFMPQSLKDVTLPDSTRKLLELKLVFNPFAASNFLILYGRPGIGKTCVLNAMWNESKRRLPASNILMLDSVNTGKFEEESIISSIITTLRGLFENGDSSHHYFVGIDEMDGFKAMHMHALKRILQRHKVICVMTSNHPDKIPTSILQCSTTIHFKPLANKLVVGNLKNICKLAGYDGVLSDESLITIADNSFGDMRTAVNNLQGAIAYFSNKFPVVKNTLFHESKVEGEARYNSTKEEWDYSHIRWTLPKLVRARKPKQATHDEFVAYWGTCNPISMCDMRQFMAVVSYHDFDDVMGYSTRPFNFKGTWEFTEDHLRYFRHLCLSMKCPTMRNIWSREIERFAYNNNRKTIYTRTQLLGIISRVSVAIGDMNNDTSNSINKWKEKGRLGIREKKLVNPGTVFYVVLE